MIRHAEHVMGTVVSFALRPGDLDERAARAALHESCATLHEADEELSTWKPESPLSRLRRGALELADASPAVSEVLRRSALARELSGGWFDPWRMPGGVDPTGLAKGWIAMQAVERLRSAGIRAAMVNAGGDVVAFGEPGPGRPWRIGIQDPRSAGQLVCVVELDGAVATSGAYERGEHVLDPESGLPARGVRSATVTGPELDLADALSTGLFAAGEGGLEWIDSIPAYEAMVVRNNGTLVATVGFKSDRRGFTRATSGARRCRQRRFPSRGASAEPPQADPDGPGVFEMASREPDQPGVRQCSCEAAALFERHDVVRGTVQK
ncbi:MAG TPA: FAD:protein FMN transferase [Thermoleophilaceae bacterium]|nr:FAD:protein FMN transferase [Thermoleophilaceae bacterium]